MKADRIAVASLGMRGYCYVDILFHCLDTSEAFFFLLMIIK